MAGLLRIDSPVYRAWNAAADLVIVNALTLLACLPVLTAGAALSACARVTMEMARDEETYIVRSWWRAWRSALGQSLLWWPLVLALAALGLWEYLLLADAGGGALSGLVLAGGVVLLGVVVWLVPLTAFFSAPLGRHIANAARLAVGALGLTGLCLLVVLAPLALVWFLPGVWTGLIWFMVLIGVGFQAYLIALIQRRVSTKIGRASCRERV